MQRIDSDEFASKEFASFITSNQGRNLSDNSSAFYELCSKFADIPLNSLKWSNSGTCDVSACFQTADIRIAKDAFKKYISEKKLIDFEGVLETIRIMHSLAVAWDDPRSKYGIVKPENKDSNYGFAGKFYYFCELPSDIWNEIRDEIISEMRN